MSAFPDSDRFAAIPKASLRAMCGASPSGQRSPLILYCRGIAVRMWHNDQQDAFIAPTTLL